MSNLTQGHGSFLIVCHYNFQERVGKAGRKSANMSKHNKIETDFHQWSHSTGLGWQQNSHCVFKWRICCFLGNFDTIWTSCLKLYCRALTDDKTILPSLNESCSQLPGWISRLCPEHIFVVVVDLSPFAMRPRLWTGSCNDFIWVLPRPRCC